MYIGHSTPSGPMVPARPSWILMKFCIHVLQDLKLKTVKYFGPIINITHFIAFNVNLTSSPAVTILLTPPTLRPYKFIRIYFKLTKTAWFVELFLLFTNNYFLNHKKCLLRFNLCFNRGIFSTASNIFLKFNLILKTTYLSEKFETLAKYTS